MNPTRRMLLLSTACLALAAWLAPPAEAHPRAYRHGHRHVHARTKAVVVVGTPRPLTRTVVVRGKPAGVLDLNVKPKTTEVWVDGDFRGTVDDFDGYPQKLALVAGTHEIRLVSPDGISVTREMRVQSGTEINVNVDLR